MESTRTESDAVITTEVARADASPEVLVADELLVEEISIDGMCGVY